MVESDCLMILRKLASSTLYAKKVCDSPSVPRQLGLTVAKITPRTGLKLNAWFISRVSELESFLLRSVPN